MEQPTIQNLIFQAHASLNRQTRPHLFTYAYTYQPKFEFLTLNLELILGFFSSKFIFQPLLLDR